MVERVETDQERRVREWLERQTIALKLLEDFLHKEIDKTERIIAARGEDGMQVKVSQKALELLDTMLVTTVNDRNMVDRLREGHCGALKFAEVFGPWFGVDR